MRAHLPGVTFPARVCEGRFRCSAVRRKWTRSVLQQQQRGGGAAAAAAGGGSGRSETESVASGFPPVFRRLPEAVVGSSSVRLL
ncbi:hypothetical protein C0J45_6372 [Silurus meridionalis]|nr:hypothetical protein C0J45_6372 [Silurus meridionalis]